MLAYAVQQLEPRRALWLGLARFNKGKEGAAAASDQGLPAAAGSVQAQQLQPRHAPAAQKRGGGSSALPRSLVNERAAPRIAVSQINPRGSELPDSPH